MRILRIVILALLPAMVPAAAGAQSLHGAPQVLDGATLVVGGKTVRLQGIAVPELGDQCMVRGKLLDCGRLARAGLMDVTAGSTVTCSPSAKGHHQCTADGYDIGFGQIHAGWAIALEDAPAHYLRKMVNARRHQRGLWAARTTNGTQPFAASLQHQPE